MNNITDKMDNVIAKIGSLKNTNSFTFKLNTIIVGSKIKAVKLGSHKILKKIAKCVSW